MVGYMSHVADGLDLSCSLAKEHGSASTLSCDDVSSDQESPPSGLELMMQGAKDIASRGS
jgi:hypothetical protein